MAKLDTAYDDASAAEGAEGESFAPAYGVFKAKIVSVTPPKKDQEKFEVKKSTNGKPHYSARYEFEYEDSSGNKKKKSAFISCIGLWFPELTKQLLVATEYDNAEGRTSLMQETDALVGAVVKIVIGAWKKDYGEREEFEGYEIKKYEGKRYIANEITGIYSAKGDVAFDELFEKNLRARFRAEPKIDGEEKQEVDEDF